MYICICNAITDKQIRQAAASGVTSLAELGLELGVGAGCGSCSDSAAAIIRETATPRNRRAKPTLYRPATAQPA
jgi:bacterioferritin-associated ferredoxin